MRGAGVLAGVRPAGRGALLALVVVATMSFATVTLAQEPFQLRYSVDKTGSSVRVNGTIMNDGRAEALDVYVTAEALDAGGKVLGRGVAFVSEQIPQKGSATFAISVPAAQAAASFRVRVSSFRFGLGVQAS